MQGFERSALVTISLYLGTWPREEHGLLREALYAIAQAGAKNSPVPWDAAWKIKADLMAVRHGTMTYEEAMTKLNNMLNGKEEPHVG